MNTNLNSIKKIHFVGIKGIGMSALALYAKGRGYRVTGSDTSEKFPADHQLKKADIQTLIGFESTHIEMVKPDLVIYTGAHGGLENVEVVAAEKRGIPVLAQGKALGLFMEGMRQISVSGSHGKTTTAAMISVIFTKAGADPSYIVGCGEIFGIGSSGHYGHGEWFIAEADEYVTDPNHDMTPRFLWQNPQILVVTNVDFDHPDVYPTLKYMKNAFEKLRNKLPTSGSLILSADDKESYDLIWLGSSVATVGRSPHADYFIKNIHIREAKTFFELELSGTFIGEFTLQVPGIHNVINAAMAAVASHDAGIPWDAIRKGLSEFTGTKRRFEKLAEHNNILFYDDYAHHPKEISSTLQAVRSWFGKRRIIVIFEPHTYSRTRALFEEFSQCFSDADVVILSDIYSSKRETPDPEITSKKLAMHTQKFHKNTYYKASPTDVEILLRTEIKPYDVVLFMGAGDIYAWGREIVKKITVLK